MVKIIIGQKPMKKPQKERCSNNL